MSIDVSSLPPLDCSDEHCITCADDGVPMIVAKVDEQRGLALCMDGEGRRHTVQTALVDPPVEGHVLLVHAGVAIATLAREASVEMSG